MAGQSGRPIWVMKLARANLHNAALPSLRMPVPCVCCAAVARPVGEGQEIERGYAISSFICSRTSPAPRLNRRFCPAAVPACAITDAGTCTTLEMRSVPDGHIRYSDPCPLRQCPQTGLFSNSALGTVMRAILRSLIWILLFPGDWVSDRLGVEKAENRDLVRMLINSLFWIIVVVVGLAIWTSTLPAYN